MTASAIFLMVLLHGSWALSGSLALLPGSYAASPGTVALLSGSDAALPGSVAPLSGSFETWPVSLGLLPVSLAGSPVSGQSRLNVEATGFTQAWIGRDMDALETMMAAEGIRLRLPDQEHEILQPRQARAALGVFLRRYLPGVAEVNRSSPTGSGTREGFAEVVWNTGSTAAGEPVIFTIFVGYGFTDNRWTITEIRVLYE